jgi:hypothetical protein
VIQFDSQYVSGAGGQDSGNGSVTGADLDHRTACEVADGGRDALYSLGINEEVLAELGLGGHGLI